MNKGSLIEWLEKHRHSNEWLAGQCGVKLSTVNSWRSNRPIPSKAVIVIESLMRSDADIQNSATPALSNVVLRIDTDEFEDWSHAGLAKGQTVTEYALSSIRSAREAELAEAAADLAAGEVGNRKSS